MKEHLGRLRQENPGVAMGDIMRLVGEAYRMDKQRKTKATVSRELPPVINSDVKQLAEGLEIVTLDDG